ncbi:MAG: sulfatase-like hydrolase/transferase, partial [Spirochaetia bacterium]|nr:sulfatase-like hydrolase/transferase [Spirochaetia bacterium]
MKRPNILITIADDQRHDALGPAVLTPELDRFAREGCRFTHAHVMGSMVPAVCVASRAMLMTGRSIFDIPASLTYGDYMGKNEGAYLPPPEGAPLLGELFSASGYETHAVGKWHSGRESFVKSFRGGSRIFLGGMGDQYRIPTFDFDPSGKYPDEKKVVIPRFSTDLFTESACDFLSNRKKDRPFFLYTAFTSPHDPRTPPKEWLDLYPPEKIPLPENFLPEHPFDNGELRIRDEMLAPHPRTPEIIQRHIADYHAMVSHLDHSIGKIHKALKDSGEWENTIVLHTSDHGLAVGRHGLMGKQNMYDHSMRIPLIFGGAFST